jgi:hypothetical protein
VDCGPEETGEKPGTDGTFSVTLTYNVHAFATFFRKREAVRRNPPPAPALGESSICRGAITELNRGCRAPCVLCKGQVMASFKPPALLSAYRATIYRGPAVISSNSSGKTRASSTERPKRADS